MNTFKHIGQGALIGLIAILSIALAYVAYVISAPTPAIASTSYFCQDQLFGATTSAVYLSPGKATTTFTLSNCVSADGYALNSALLHMQVTASSTPIATPVTIKYRVENSQNGIDWYPESTPINSTNINATTTMITGNFAEYQFTVGTSTYAGDLGGSSNASSTIGGAYALNRIHMSMLFPTNTLRTRIVFYMPAGSTNAALWAEVIGKREFLVR